VNPLLKLPCIFEEYTVICTIFWKKNCVGYLGNIIRKKHGSKNGNLFFIGGKTGKVSRCQSCDGPTGRIAPDRIVGHAGKRG